MSVLFSVIDSNPFTVLAFPMISSKFNFLSLVLSEFSISSSLSVANTAAIVGSANKTNLRNVAINYTFPNSLLCFFLALWTVELSVLLSLFSARTVVDAKSCLVVWQLLRTVLSVKNRLKLIILKPKIKTNEKWLGMKEVTILKF